MDLSLPKSPRSKFEDRDIYSALCLLLVSSSSLPFPSMVSSEMHFREPVLPTASTSTAPCRFVSMMEGSAHRPYVYRQLLPLIANWIDSRVPDSLKDKLYTKSDLERRLQLEVLTSPTAQSRPILFAISPSTCSISYPPGSRFACCTNCAEQLVCLPRSRTLVGYFYPLFPFLMSFGGTCMTFRACLSCSRGVDGASFDGWFLLPVVALATLNKESFFSFSISLPSPSHARFDSPVALAAGGHDRRFLGGVLLAPSSISIQPRRSSRDSSSRAVFLFLNVGTGSTPAK